MLSRCFCWVRVLGVVFFGSVVRYVSLYMWLVSYSDLYERNYAWRKTFVHSFFCLTSIVFFFSGFTKVDYFIEKQR